MSVAYQNFVYNKVKSQMMLTKTSKKFARQCQTVAFIQKSYVLYMNIETASQLQPNFALGYYDACALCSFILGIINGSISYLIFNVFYFLLNLLFQGPTTVKINNVCIFKPSTAFTLFFKVNWNGNKTQIQASRCYKSQIRIPILKFF